MTQEQVLERFHRALIEEIQTQRPEYLTGPFTVAEIYQNLVPYGSHRDRIGVEMNADYEDALLRLLAGEGGFLILESEPALRDIREELETSNPNTGLYREFAAVDVRLNQSRLDLAASAVDELTDLAEELDADMPVPMAELAPAEDGVSLFGIVPPGVDVFDGQNGSPATTGAPEPLQEEPVDGPWDPDRHDLPSGGLQPEFVEPDAGAETDEDVAAAATTEDDVCRSCRATLPERETLNFCPHCGTDLRIIPCASCGENLELDWRFCTACGAEVD